MPVRGKGFHAFLDGTTSALGYPSTYAKRFPWNTPTKDKAARGDLDLFPEQITDDEIRHRYERYQLAKVIINEPVEDALRNGFTIEKHDSKTAEELDKFNRAFQLFWERTLRKPFEKTVKLGRAYGYSVLFFGLKDSETPLSERPDYKNFPEIEYILPMCKTDFDVSVTETLPRGIDLIRVRFGDEEDKGKIVDPSRFIYFENESLFDDRKGQSELAPCWDLLTVQKNADWAIGQNLWRGAAGLLTLLAPKGAESTDADSALEAIDNIHAKTRLVLPPGWDAKDLSPARVAFNVQASYDALVKQIAAATRIPALMLSPSFRRRFPDPEYEGYLFSLQTSVLSPLLRQCFTFFQLSKQLPEGDYQINWKPVLDSPYETAKAYYMTAIGKKLESEKKSEEAKDVIVRSYE